MALQIPNAMGECIYFTRRVTPEIGKIIAWVERQRCPKCEKGMMAKPLDEKKGTFKTRAKEYVCGACGHSVEKAAYEATLTCSIIYTCPTCGHSGETQVPFRRRSWNGVKAIVYQCGKCDAKLGVTKKMREGKGTAHETNGMDDDF